MILKSLSKSSFDLCTASTTSFNVCLFTWVAYLVIFRIKMTWTRDFYCLFCVGIIWFTHCLISNVSLVVALPVGYFNASPRKGNRLLF